MLIAIILSTIAVVLAVLPANPIGGKWRAVAAVIVFVAYAFYVELSRSDQGRLQIPVWEMVVMGMIAGGTIALLIQFNTFTMIMGLGLGAVLGLCADRWTAFVKGI
jgi:hypothetical protein